jgi:membrane protein implicated in regulation of membrane protease activity
MQWIRGCSGSFAAVAFAVAEIATVSFFLAPFAAGALVAAGLDLIGLSLGAQIAAFLVSSIALLTLVRPIARRHLTAPPAVRTGVAALVGREALVLERIVNDEGVGCVRLDGRSGRRGPTTTTRSSRRAGGCTCWRSGAPRRS